MHVCCLDLEGVLLPEIWIAVSKKYGVRELRLTTRDIPDYDELMTYRLNILEKERISLRQIQAVAAGLKPLPGARRFISALMKRFPVIILSDTFYEFAAPLMKQLGNPTLFCHFLETDKRGMISRYRLRQKDSKRQAVLALRKLNFKIAACGDSYNDVSMLKTADRGIFFKAPPRIKKEFPEFQTASTHTRLLKLISEPF